MKISYAQAINKALEEEMKRNKSENAIIIFKI